MKHVENEKTKTTHESGKVELNNANLRKANLALRSVNHKLRQEMVELLLVQEMTVTDLRIKLRLEQSVASQHLAILRNAGVVSTRREGKFIYYSVDTKRVDKLNKFISQIAEGYMEGD